MCHYEFTAMKHLDPKTFLDDIDDEVLVEVSEQVFQALEKATASKKSMSFVYIIIDEKQYLCLHISCIQDGMSTMDKLMDVIEFDSYEEYSISKHLTQVRNAEPITLN